MQKLVFTNGGGQTIDLTSGNFGITNWEGLSGVGLNIQTQQVPFQDGGVFLDALIEQREISVTVAIQDNNDLSARYERKRELISALNPKLGEGVLIYTNDYLSRQIKAVPQLPIFENKNSNDAGTLKASVTFSCPSPYWEDLEDTVVSLNGLTTIQNNGDVPCQVKIQLPAVCSNPIIYNRKNDKQIGINGTTEERITINTNYGNKSVIGETLNFAWNGGGTYSGFAHGQGKTIYAGTQIFVEDGLSGKTSSFNFGSLAKAWVLYNNGMFLIGQQGSSLGQSDYLYYSYDGINWDSNIAPLMKSIAYGNGKYIGVYEWANWYSYGYSYDGINWSSEYWSIGVMNYIYFGNNMFITVGEDGRIFTSSDGTTWTERTSGVSSSLKSVVFNGEFFIVVGDGCILKSMNGTSWTIIESSSPRIYLSVTSNNDGLLLAITNAKIFTSEDGETWTERTINVNGYPYRYTNLEENKFVIVGSGGLIAKSLNGIDWEIISFTTGNTINGITFGNGKYIGVGATSGTSTKGFILTSTDKKNWSYSEITLALDYNTINAITYGNNTFVAVGTRFILTSTDGINWTYDNSFTQNIVCVCFGDGKFLAGSNSRIFLSTDGITWQEVYSANITAIKYLNGKFYAGVKTNGTILVSSDGETWTEATRDSVRNASYDSFAYGNGIYIATFGASAIYYSYNGTTWYYKKNQNLDGYNYKNVCFSNGIFYCNSNVSVYGRISTNGLDWVNKYLPTLSGLGTSFANNNDVIFAGSAIVSLETIETINRIATLSEQSDMTFNLETGNNNILFTADNNDTAILSFRQKYIGV